MGKIYNFYDHFDLVKKDPPKKLPSDVDDSLIPANIIANPTDPMYDDDKQLQRSVNFSVIRTPKGRIFQSFFSALKHNIEDTGNYILISCSDDEGKTFRIRAAINPPNFENTRVFETAFWLDPKGRLHIFYVQTYRRMDGREGVWRTICENPDDETLVFSTPERICDGIIPSPITTLKDGRVVFLSYLQHPFAWHGDPTDDFDTTDIIYMPEKIGIAVNVSTDGGETFTQIAKGIQFPYVVYYESNLVEKNDGRLWILIRGMNCTGQTFSHDGGYTWSPAVVNSRLPLPNTHFFINRLKSGRLLLLANYKADLFSYFIGRNHLTALLSDDDGETWSHSLMIDVREGAEQPAFYEAENGNIYISYGRAPQELGEMYLAIVTEEDILAGKLVTPNSRLRILSGKSTGMQKQPWYPGLLEWARKNGLEE